jgi:hypothetical protein
MISIERRTCKPRSVSNMEQILRRSGRWSLSLRDEIGVLFAIVL